MPSLFWSGKQKSVFNGIRAGAKINCVANERKQRENEKKKRCFLIKL